MGWHKLGRRICPKGKTFVLTILRYIYMELLRHEWDTNVHIWTSNWAWRLDITISIIMNLNYNCQSLKKFGQIVNSQFYITLIGLTKWLSPIVIVPKKNGKLQICVNYHQFMNSLTKKDPFCHNPTLGLTTKARAWKVAGQEGSPWLTSHISRSAKSVKGWTLTLPSELPFWELESQWTSESSKGDCRGQNPLDWRVIYIIERYWNVDV